jgi:polyhydroxybutyrate depolymerase
VFTTGLSAPVPGCALTPQQTGVLDLLQLKWSRAGGVLVVPESAPGTALPVVLVFHGAYGSGEEARAQFALETAADGGAIFVYPDAIKGTWDIGPLSNDGWRVETLLGNLAANYCIDPARLYLAGYSAGAVFTLYLGCNVPGSFRGMASVAGSETRFDNRCCTGSISALFIHGTMDDAFPVGQGQYTRNDLLRRDQCTTTSTPESAHCLGYLCPAPWAVNYCEWSGGHLIPGWAGQEIWRFIDESG